MSGIEPRRDRLMGTAPGFVREALDREMIDDICLVSERQVFQRCRDMARKEGLLVGISSGAVAHGTLEIAQRLGNAQKVIVCIFADTGQRYLSVEGLFELPRLQVAEEEPRPHGTEQTSPPMDSPCLASISCRLPRGQLRMLW